MGKGLEKVPARARQLGCESFQIFSRNPRSWKARQLDEKTVTTFKEHRLKEGLRPLAVHVNYLINLSTPQEENYLKSCRALEEDLERAGQLGAEFLVMHPGSHLGSGLEKGIERLTGALADVLSRVDNEVGLLLENVSGAGTEVGNKLSSLGQVIKDLDDGRLGICLDTAHAFSAGYDLTSSHQLNKMLEEIDESMGLERLQLIHANDSKYELGSGGDRHQHIGEGYLGEEAFLLLLGHPQLSEVPFILETPQKEEGDELKNINRLRELQQQALGAGEKG